MPAITETDSGSVCSETPRKAALSACGWPPLFHQTANRWKDENQCVFTSHPSEGPITDYNTMPRISKHLTTEQRKQSCLGEAAVFLDSSAGPLVYLTAVFLAEM